MGILKPKDKEGAVLPEELSMSEKVGNSDIEKGMPDVENPQGASNMKKVGLFLGLLLATGMIVAGLLAFSSNDDTTADSEKSDIEMVGATQSHDFTQDKTTIEEQQELEVVAASDVQTTASGEQVPPVQAVQADMPQQQAAEETIPTKPQEKPVNPRLLGDVIVNVSDSGSNAGMGVSDGNIGGSLPDSSPFMATAATIPPNTFPDDESKGNTFADSLNPTQTPSVKAMRRTNMDYVLAKGTNILCTLDTQIITTRAGFTRCVITRDIYSANGKVLLLLEKGSRIIGEQTAAMLQGQARVGILWNEVTTPQGVIVRLASPAAGQLGAAGIGARVKYHFWQRFGGAIMISLIGDLGDSYANRQNSGDGQRISFENSSEAAQDMATEALKNSITSPPTAYINHGTLINIMVARDVDFSGVYERVNPYQF